MTPEQQKAIELARWLILKTAQNSGHIGATETMMMAVIQDEISVTRQSLRNEIIYLQKRKLLEVVKDEVKPWRVTLTRAGQDLVEYQISCDPGIARPKLPPEWVQ